ncbi:DNA polymerase II large subunit [Candidatus Woesearchaeota archaeon]|nr:DNA polymerase II large subunit [Candidatus Woesearchaeota archaeon]
MAEIASESMKEYFAYLDRGLNSAYALAGAARKKGLDPEDEVNIPLAKNMAERVVGLISVVAPQLVGTNLPGRIMELEKELGLLDWRVGFQIAVEVAQQKFCTFSNHQEALEIGIRVGFAYLTLGIVSAPLEGFIGLKIKKRKDGREYFALQYAGPIRGAGGTAAATSVILSDYVRVKMGYAPYDPDEKEVNRYNIEVHDYHEWVTNLQYHPSDEVLKFMVSHLPVEVDGDPTEKREVSNYKDLPRIEGNLIRGGVALVLAEGLCQKAPKLWKRLSKWGKELGLDWGWLEEFIQLKEKIHAAHASKDKVAENKDGKKIVKANNTFIMDLVAGRPILTHPLGVGGFRLRYGRTRMTGFSAAAISPATQAVLNKYIAIGTQLKVERPGKAATISVCDNLDGPIVLLQNGNVLMLKTEEEAKRHSSQVKEVIFLGDILFNYGDFSENGQDLVPAGYCIEWWAQELEKAFSALTENLSVSTKNSSVLNENPPLTNLKNSLSTSPGRLQELISNPFQNQPSFDEARDLSLALSIPLHSRFTYYWKLISTEDLSNFVSWLKNGKIIKEDLVVVGGVNDSIEKIIIPYSPKVEEWQKAKRTLELCGVPHEVVNAESVVLLKEEALVLSFLFCFKTEEELQALNLPTADFKNSLDWLNSFSRIKMRDKAGTFIGARMGRPEKAKMRAMTGSPQVMFPVGEEGDRLRSFQAALKAGKVNSAFPLSYCSNCKKEMIYANCEECGQKTKKRYNCRNCGPLDKDKCRHGAANSFSTRDLDIKYYFDKAAARLGEVTYPDLIKGIRGTSNKEHVVEHLAKGFLRAKHNIYVNKDGTTRYDCTEMPITHFKPKEIKTSLEKLRELGYVADINDQPLTSQEQILEIKPQDVILPGFDSLDESAPKVLSRVANFVDDLLVRFYGLQPFYNIKKDEDLVGHLVIGLAPHISAGLIGRIIGFSETQALLCHPMYHAGLRRDCFDYNTFIPLLVDGKWTLEKIGVVVEKFNPTKIVDVFGTKEVIVSGIKTIGKDQKIVAVKNFTKHAPHPMLKIKTKLGRELKITSNHKQIIFETNLEGSKVDKKVVRAQELKVGDTLALPYNIKITSRDIPSINLLDLLAECDWVMVRKVNSNVPKIKVYAREHYSKKEFDNYTRRDSYPINFISKLKLEGKIKKVDNFKLAAKRDTVEIPISVPVNENFLKLVGLYVSEGYSRGIKKGGNGLYQVYIAAENEEIRAFIGQTMLNIFGLKTTENKKDRMTYSSRLLYHLFVNILKCGCSAYEKRMPEMFLNLPLKKQGHLLSGYFEGDGSVSRSDLRATFDTVSSGLLRDLDFMLGQMGIFVKNYTYTKLPGDKLKEFYIKKGREIPHFTITKGTIQSVFMDKFIRYVNFISSRKKAILQHLASTKKKVRISQKYDSEYVYDTITSVTEIPAEESYCLNVEGNEVIANSVLTKQCDGDEACAMLLMDALLNFSRQYLPERRGAKSVPPDTLVYYRQKGKISTEFIGPLTDKLMEENKSKIRRDGDYEILEINGYEAISFDASTRGVSFFPITKFIRHSSSEYISKVKTTHGSICVTGDHSLFVTKGKEIISKEVRELQESDFILTLGKINLPESELGAIDLCQLMPEKIYVPIDSKLKKEILGLEVKVKEKLQYSLGHNFYRYINGDRKIPLAILQEIGISRFGNKVFLKNGGAINRFFTIDEDFVRLSAYLIAEGHLHKKRAPEIVNTNPSIVKEIEASLNKITGSKAAVSWDHRAGRKHCARIRLPAVLRELLLKMGFGAVKSGEKHLPPFVFTLPSPLKQLFLDTYLKGDGHYYAEKNFSMLYSKSHYLAAELSLLAHSLGKKTTINKGTRCLQILYSDYNHTDSWWPLQDYTKELYGALRKEGLVKENIRKLIGNYYNHQRTRAASRGAFKKFNSLFSNTANKELSEVFKKIECGDLRVEKVRKIEKFKSPYKYVYDLEVPKHQNFLCGPHPIFAHNTMDSPLVLTSILYPTEVDDQVHGVDVVWKYPLELYEAALEMKKPWEVKVNGKKIEQIGDRLNTPLQYEKIGYTMPVDDFNKGVQCSAYKILPSMEEKIAGQMDIAQKVRAVDMDDVAYLVIQKHLLRDIKGNLRKFSSQQFRCVGCNTKFRRPPLSNKCNVCEGRIIFTITEGSVVKYLGPSLVLAEKYDFSPYLKQTLNILKRNVDHIFGREKEKQVGLGGFMG